MTNTCQRISFNCPCAAPSARIRKVGLGRVLANVIGRRIFVRCGGCEIDPLKPARYCECCGREISPNQNGSGEPHRSAAQPATVAADSELYDWAPKRSAWD